MKERQKYAEPFEREFAVAATDSRGLFFLLETKQAIAKAGE